MSTDETYGDKNQNWFEPKKCETCECVATKRRCLAVTSAGRVIFPCGAIACGEPVCEDCSSNFGSTVLHRRDVCLGEPIAACIASLLRALTSWVLDSTSSAPSLLGPPEVRRESSNHIDTCLIKICRALEEMCCTISKSPKKCSQGRWLP